MANPQSRILISEDEPKGLIPQLTFHTTFSHSHAILEKHHPAKPPKLKFTYIHDPNFLTTTHMNLLTLHLEALTGGSEVDSHSSRVHSRLFFIRNSANPTLQIFFFLDLNLITDLYCTGAWQLVRALNPSTGIDQLCSSEAAIAIPL